MSNSNTLQIAIIIALLSAFGSFLWTGAGAQGHSQTIDVADNAEVAVFAGGCFWCVESDFDKVDGVISTISGYPGGDSPHPPSENHSATRQLDLVAFPSTPDVVSYDYLVEYFFRHIDPTDAGGQFCDRGHSYTTAIFAQNEQQADIARAEIAEIEAMDILPGPVVTAIRGNDMFYPAEEYHQDYYLKQPLKYQFYRGACGRDEVVDRIWSMAADG